MQESTKYYEFNNAEYYALIRVTSKYNLMFNAMKLYVKLVGGYDNFNHMCIEKAYPTEISEDDALFKFLKCKTHMDMKVGEVMRMFNTADDNSLLIVDGALL